MFNHIFLLNGVKLVCHYTYFWFLVSSICIFTYCVICLQEEDEVPDDETVNQMIARSEDEFEQFMVSLSLTFIDSVSDYFLWNLWGEHAKHHTDSIYSVVFKPLTSVNIRFLPCSTFFSAWIWTGVAKKPATPSGNLA